MEKNTRNSISEVKTKKMVQILLLFAVFIGCLFALMYWQVQTKFRADMINRTITAADSLSAKVAEAVRVEDVNALRLLQGEVNKQLGVEYSFIKDARGRVLSSSFEGNTIPPELQTVNILTPGVPFGTQPVTITRKDGTVNIIDIATPIAGGTLGTVHVGLNLSRIKWKEYSPSDQNVGTTENIQFGSALSLTGKLSKAGNLVKNGYELWKDTTNKNGGIRIGDKTYLVNIKYYDNESDPEKSAKLAEKLITEDKIKLILGPYGSDLVFATSAVTEKYDVLMVQTGGSSDNIYTRGFKNNFGIYSVASEYMDDLYEMLGNKSPKPSTVAILYATDLFSTAVAQGAKATAEKSGYKVVFYHDIPKSEKDLSAIMVTLKAKKPDVIIGCAYFQESVTLVNQFKKYKINPKALAFSMATTLPDFVRTLKEDAENIFGTAQWTTALKYKDPLFGSNAEFIKAYEAKYKTAPNYHAAGGAAAGVIFQQAIEKAGTKDDIKKIRRALANYKAETLYGRIEFDETGKVVGKGMPIVQIQNGVQRTVYQKGHKKVVYLRTGGTREVYPEAVLEAMPVYPKPRQWK